MKNEQQNEAKELYFHSNLSKTEIASKLGVNRKTVLFWAQQGNWDKLRLSARNMPSLIAEKCYYLIDQYLNSLLINGDVTTMNTLQLRHAQTIHLLATSVKKLKNRSTVNESMEMFNFFMDGLNRRNPELAAQIAPEMEEYITIRKNVETTDFLMEEFRHDGTLPYPDKDIQENLQDEKDNEELKKDFEEFLKNRNNNEPPSDLDTPEPLPPTPTPSGGQGIKTEPEPTITYSPSPQRKPHLTEAA